MAGSRQSLHAVPKQTFAALLRQQRLADDLTQAELGERFGVRQQTLGAWERGERPQARLLGVLAQYVGLGSEHDLIDLLDEEAAASRADAGPIREPGAWESTSDAEAMKLLTRTYLEGVRRQSLTPEDRSIFTELIAYYRNRVREQAQVVEPAVGSLT